MADSPARRHEDDHGHNGVPAGELRDVRDLVDHERADDGARIRRDRFWRGHVDQEMMTLSGLLLAMSERGETLRLVLRNGTHRIGRVTAVGSDVVALTETNGTEVLLAMTQIVSLRGQSSKLIAVDAAPCAAILRDQILALTEARAEVRLVLDAGPTESGTLEACGVGVVALRNLAREIVYIAEARIAEIVLVGP